MLKLNSAKNLTDYPNQWQDIPHGIEYQQTLQTQITPWLAKMFGVHMVKLGQLSMGMDTTSCAINHQINIAEHGEQLDIQADYHRLPLMNKSIDACLLMHLLPYTSHPHQILREVDRVLLDDGWLVISSFNLLSIIGLGKMVPVLGNKSPYASHLYTKFRLIDWLTLLNYEVLYHRSSQVCPWHSFGEPFLSTHIPVMGCLNLIVARKRTIPLTLNPLQNYKLKLNWGKKVMGTARTFERHGGKVDRG